MCREDIEIYSVWLELCVGVLSERTCQVVLPFMPAWHALMRVSRVCVLVG